MAQQTSVDYLIEQLQAPCRGIPSHIIEKAMEKHKEETMDAFQAGKWDWSTHVNHGKNSMDPAEYYNETFKK